MPPPEQEDVTISRLGETFPDEAMARTTGTLWDPERMLLYVGAPGITAAEVHSWGALTRVHALAYRTQIVVLLQYMDGSAEFPGFRSEGSALPDWVRGDTSGEHLFFRLVSSLRCERSRCPRM